NSQQFQISATARSTAPRMLPACRSHIVSSPVPPVQASHEVSPISTAGRHLAGLDVAGVAKPLRPPGGQGNRQHKVVIHPLAVCLEDLVHRSRDLHPEVLKLLDEGLDLGKPLCDLQPARLKKHL